jgi:hypothetical protein
MSRFVTFDVTLHRLAGCLCRCPGHNDRVDIGVVLGAVNAELSGRWQLQRRLAGGWNEGAYLLIRGGSRAVLKWRASDPERLLGAGAGGGGPGPRLACPAVAGHRPGADGRGLGGAGVH